MVGIFTVFGVVLGVFLYKYYLDGVGGAIYAIMFVAGFGGMGALVGYLIELVKRKLSYNASVKSQVSPTSEVIMSNNIKTIKGFGGWLYIFSFGLAYQFFFNLKYAYDNYLLMGTEEYKILIDINSENYNPKWHFATITEMIMEVLSVLFIILIAYFCVKKSRKFKTFTLFFISITLAFQIFDFVLRVFIERDYTQQIFTDTEMYTGIYRALVYSVVWIPYFIISKRVKNTYV